MKPILIIQNCPAESPGTIVAYLEKEKLPYKVIHSYRPDPLPNLSDISTTICLGCPCSINDYHQHDYLKTLYAFVSSIVREDRPYLGLCFGGQMLAKILGAKVEKNHVKEIGTYNITLTEPGQADPLFKGIGPTFKAFHWHGDTFKIPFGLENLATSADCRNQAFRKGRQVGLQFHFETDAAEVPLWCDVYKSELDEIGKAKEAVVVEYQRGFETTRELNFKFLDNFFAMM